MDNIFNPSLAIADRNEKCYSKNLGGRSFSHSFLSIKHHTLLIKIIFSLQKFQNQGKKTGPEKQPGGTKTKKNESSKSRRGNHQDDDDSGGKILHESMLLKIQSMN